MPLCSLRPEREQARQDEVHGTIDNVNVDALS